MQRYFVAPENMDDQTVWVTGDDVDHIVKVMRNTVGDEIICCNGQGQCAISSIEEISKAGVRCQIRQILPEGSELPLRVTIAQGLPKGDKMDWVIQKGTELGARGFIPFSSSRTVVQLDQKKETKRLERWGRIAKEAAEQSHRMYIPEVSPVHSWKQLLQAGQQFDLTLLAYEQEKASTLHQSLMGLKQDEPNLSVLLLIGPEGGFSSGEADEAQQAGFQPVMLGRRILRTETAGLYALSCISYFYEQLGGRL